MVSVADCVCVSEACVMKYWELELVVCTGPIDVAETVVVIICSGDI
jgi:hypothetical protein